MMPLKQRTRYVSRQKEFKNKGNEEGRFFVQLWSTQVVFYDSKEDIAYLITHLQHHHHNYCHQNMQDQTEISIPKTKLYLDLVISHIFIVGLLSLHDQVVQILAFLGFLLEFADDRAEVFDVL